MRLDFTHGIVKCQKDLSGNVSKFLQVNNNDGGYIDLVVAPDATIIVFAHKNKNYLVEENQSIEKAWGPFQAFGQTQFLFWDINFASGALSRGYTTLSPVISSGAPNNPANDQHWFDTSVKCMKVWNGSKWLEKIRVFAGIYDQSAVLAAKPTGTQVGLKRYEVFAGNIILGTNGSPLRDTDGTFVTTETELVVARTSSENIKFDAVLIYKQSRESIPKFHLVSYSGPDSIRLASYLNLDRQVNGIVREHLYNGETGHVITNGSIKNDEWSFAPNMVGRPLFCGPSGQVTLSVPPTGVVQQIGIVADIDTIHFWPMLPIVTSEDLGAYHTTTPDMDTAP